LEAIVISTPENNFGDVVDEGIARLNVALRLLKANHSGDDHDEIDCEGYDLTIIEEIIEDVVSTLQAASERDVKNNPNLQKDGAR
jgi:hypothetical protein